MCEKEKDELIVMASPERAEVVGEVERKCENCGCACYTSCTYSKEARFMCLDCVRATGLAETEEIIVTDEAKKGFEAWAGRTTTKEELLEMAKEMTKKKTRKRVAF